MPLLGTSCGLGGDWPVALNMWEHAGLTEDGLGDHKCARGCRLQQFSPVNCESHFIRMMVVFIHSAFVVHCIIVLEPVFLPMGIPHVLLKSIFMILTMNMLK